MAYNNAFPVGYPYYIPQVQNPVTPAPAASSGLIWVQGEAGAKSYMVGANNTVSLWDSESQTIYLKSADASGMPSMRILDYTIREPKATLPEANTDYATKDDLEALKDEIKVLKAKLKKEAS